MESPRPLSVTLIAIAQFLISILSLGAGMILVLIVTGQIQVLTSDVTVFPLPLKALVGLGLVISTLGLAASIGLWQLKRWGWILSLVFQGLCILNNAVGIVAGQPHRHILVRQPLHSPNCGPLSTLRAVAIFPHLVRGCLKRR